MLESARWLLAHQGGWDELLMFGTPIVLAVIAVRWADRRARRRADDAAEHPAPPAGEHQDADH